MYDAIVNPSDRGTAGMPVNAEFAEGLERYRRESLEARLGSLFKKIGLTVDDERMGKIFWYASELWRWNRAYNLVSRKLEWEGLVELILDSLTPLSLKGLFRPGIRVLDVGAGAGMPGIPLLILSDGFELDLLEPIRKKVTFMRHVIRSLSLEGAKVIPERVESLSQSKGSGNTYDIVISRAAMLPGDFFKKAAPLLKEGGKALGFAGPGEVKEIRRESATWAQRGLEMEGIKSVSRLTGKENHLVIAKKI